MGLMQTAYRTYENHAHLAGVSIAGQKTLSPISHMTAKAYIEITLDADGGFCGAVPVPKAESKTIIPVTEESATRSGDTDRTHPLSDQLRYLAAYGGLKHKAYLDQLTSWASSEHSHPKVMAVLRYIQGGTILSDLFASGVISLNANGEPDSGKIEDAEYNKCLVRWRVLLPQADSPSPCWEDISLFRSFIAFYGTLRSGNEQGTCIISGSQDSSSSGHPKGVISASFSAKLISANDGSGFTYRGRFSSADQTGVLGYIASQKAHSALRWIADNHSVIIGGRAFLCWNPEGRPLPSIDIFKMESEIEPQANFEGYQEQLRQSLGGYRQALSYADDAVIAVLEAATTGRLSITYYNELKASDFLDRLQSWYESCCWCSRSYGIQAPPIGRIARCAFGTQRGEFIDVDDKLLREQIQRLLHCIVDCQPIPADIVRALSEKANHPLSYTSKNRETLLCTTCAVVRKYRNDKQKKEEWKLALDETSQDRSYLYGRLLAVAEQVERSTHSGGEDRDTNAIRMQTIFSQRPAYAWRILHEKLTPYFAHLAPGLQRYYKNIIQDIVANWSPGSLALNRKLDDAYLLGYYHQRAALTTKKNATKDTTIVTEENENESAE